jgi:hypothetical protein
MAAMGSGFRRNDDAGWSYAGDICAGSGEPAMFGVTLIDFL